MSYRKESARRWEASLALGVASVIGLAGATAILHRPAREAHRTPANEGFDSPYRFGGGCPSQGQWTQAALENARQLYTVIKGLKDNPACKGKESAINSIVENFQSAEKALQSAKSDPFGSRAETIAAEIDALRLVVASGKTSWKDYSQTLYRTTLQSAAWASKAADLNPVAFDHGGTAAIASLYNRTTRAANYGTELASKIFKALPALDECLMGQPDVAMNAFSAAIKVGAAFASSGEGLGSNLGGAVASLAESMRDQRFTKAMRQLDQLELWYSVSCLLETTTKSYCDAENARDLLEFSKKTYAKNMADVKRGMRDPHSDNPLEGYYLLIRELPLIGNWITQMKLGTDPRSKGDSDQQVEAIERFNEYWKMKKVVAGNLNLKLREMNALTTMDARQQAMIAIVDYVATTLTTGNGQKFVEEAIPELNVPFYLLGMDSPPPEVVPDVKNTQRYSAKEWMMYGGEGKTIQPIFKDLSRVSRTLESRLRDLLFLADQNAAAFYRQRLVVDVVNLVNMSVSGQNVTVYQAFHHVVRYLERFRARLPNTNVDNMILAQVDQTLYQVKSVLLAYERLMKIGRDFRGDRSLISKVKIDPQGNLIPTGSREVDEAAREVVDTVFEELEVLYMSDVKLTNRLSTIINRDFAIRVKNGIDLSEHQRELMMASQEHLVEKIVQFHGQNLNAAIQDIQGAQGANTKALLVFEQVFSDQLYLYLMELNEIAHGRPVNQAKLNELRQRLLKENFKRDRKVERQANWKEFGDISIPRDGWAAFGKSLNALWRLVSPKSGMRQDHPELYDRYTDRNSITQYGDDRHGTFAQLRAKICVQSLAFTNRERFYPLCKDAVLESAFTTPSNRSLEFRYATAMAPIKPGRNKLHEVALDINTDKNEKSKRICAFNNYMIKNWVQVLQDRDQTQDDELQQGEYKVEILDREKKAREDARKLAEEEDRLRKEEERQIQEEEAKKKKEEADRLKKEQPETQKKDAGETQKKDQTETQSDQESKLTRKPPQRSSLLTESGR